MKNYGDFWKNIKARPLSKQRCQSDLRQLRIIRSSSDMSESNETQATSNLHCPSCGRSAGMEPNGVGGTDVPRETTGHAKN